MPKPEPNYCSINLHLRATNSMKGRVSRTVFLILLYSATKEHTVQVRKMQSVTNEKRIFSKRQLT